MAFLKLLIIIISCLFNNLLGIDLTPSNCIKRLSSTDTLATTVYLPSAIQCAAYCQVYTKNAKAVFTYEGNTCKIYKNAEYYTFGSSDPYARYCMKDYKLYRTFWIIKIDLSFWNATQICKKINMKLLSIEFEAEAERVYGFFLNGKGNATLMWTSGYMGLFEGTQQYYWLGFNSSMTYNGWIQGSPYEFSNSNGVVLNATSPYWGHIDDTAMLRCMCEGTI